MEEISSIKVCFPNAKIQLCRVHVIQAFRRHIKKKLNYDALIEEELEDDEQTAEIKANAKSELFKFVFETVDCETEAEFETIYEKMKSNRVHTKKSLSTTSSTLQILQSQQDYILSWHQQS
jgi:hypothetical protein